MSTQQQSVGQTICLIGHSRISVPRTEKFAGKEVFRSDQTSRCLVIDARVLGSRLQRVELGKPRKTPEHWAQEWSLRPAEGASESSFLADALVATEYVDGVSLTDLVTHLGPLPLTQLLTLVAALEMAHVSDPEAAQQLTPDRALFTALGKPRFLARRKDGIGPEGCLWYALTGQAPPSQRLAVGLLRDDLPRRLEAVVDAYLAGQRSLADVRSVLHQLTEPRPLQLGLPPALRAGRQTEPTNDFSARLLTGRVLLGVFTAAAVLLAGWQIDRRMAPSTEAATVSPPAENQKDVSRSWDPEVCLWDRLGTARQAALEGRGQVAAYTYPGSAAFVTETALQDELKQAGTELRGLQTRLVPGQHDGHECLDQVGLFAWQPATSSVPVREVEVFSLVSGHTQHNKDGQVSAVEPLKQRLSVQLRLHHGRWLISSIHVVDAHAQS